MVDKICLPGVRLDGLRPQVCLRKLFVSMGIGAEGDSSWRVLRGIDLVVAQEAMVNLTRYKWGMWSSGGMLGRQESWLGNRKFSTAVRPG